MNRSAATAHISRPDTRWASPSSAYAGDHLCAARGDEDRAESWMGRLGGHPGEPSHPGFPLASHANGWQGHRPRNTTVGLTWFEEDAGPATHPVQNADTEKARCANTGLLRSSLDWMFSGLRLDRCHIA